MEEILDEFGRNEFLSDLYPGNWLDSGLNVDPLRLANLLAAQNPNAKLASEVGIDGFDYCSEFGSGKNDSGYFGSMQVKL